MGSIHTIPSPISQGKSVNAQQAGVHTPGVHTPGVHTPGAHTPGAHTPGAHTPGAHTPRVHTPGAHTPGVHTSGAHTPGGFPRFVCLYLSHSVGLGSCLIHLCGYPWLGHVHCWFWWPCISLVGSSGISIWCGILYLRCSPNPWSHYLLTH